MTNQEAVRYFKSMIFPSDGIYSTLRAIEANKLAIESLELQIPKYPKFYRRYEYSDADGNRGIWETGFECPNCECNLNSDNLDIVCPDCYQRLNWEVPNAVDIEID